MSKAIEPSRGGGEGAGGGGQEGVWGGGLWQDLSFQILESFPVATRQVTGWKKSDCKRWTPS